jgi:hypothetical protein
MVASAAWKLACRTLSDAAGRLTSFTPARAYRLRLEFQSRLPGDVHGLNQTVRDSKGVAPPDLWNDPRPGRQPTRMEHALLPVPEESQKGFLR